MNLNLKKIAVVVSAKLFILSMSIFSHAQTIPIQVEQNQLDRGIPRSELRNSSQANDTISERQAVNLARQRFAGNILRISLVGQGDNRRYQIRMENQGKIFTVFVHASTGTVTGGN